MRKNDVFLSSLTFMAFIALINLKYFRRLMNKLLTLALLFFVSFAVMAQENEDSPKRRGIPKGMHFFLDASYNYTFNNYLGYDYALNDYPAFSFALGYQFCPYFFFGVGGGVNIYDGNTGVPVFGDFRVHFMNRRVSPFIDARVGYSFSVNGLYYSPAVGCHVGLGRVCGISASVGYTAQYCDITTASYSIRRGVHYSSANINNDGLTFKVAFDW